ncbi:MAG TPA: tetratricopeptide repeat protein [Mariniphaga anaerophila]|uniref:Tetratricopeptide repeat protein n=1 Tax=Mariniphaga anaerophila TaxID=1484053 RepID=A0A831PRP2_9BACT|nr:tetratricopeptide repeat protein [Mariniphaga anaerophila]
MEKEEFYRSVENPEALNQETLTGFKQLTEDFPFFQAGWILYLKNCKLTGSEQFEEALKKTAPIVPDRKQLYRLLLSENENFAKSDYFNRMVVREVYTAGDATQQKPEKSLIDRFLSSDHSPIKLDKPGNEHFREDHENEDIVAKSVNESDELITETLAMIYFQQKKYDKALDAFQKLSLKYPEKSVYFASRIEEIEKLKNI